MRRGRPALLKKPLVALAFLTAMAMPAMALVSELAGAGGPTIVGTVFSVTGWATSGVLVRRLLSYRTSLVWDAVGAIALGLPTGALFAGSLYLIYVDPLDGPFGAASVAAGPIIYTYISLAAFAVLCLVGWWQMRRRRRQEVKEAL